jgi:hypothetical protein
MSSVPISMQMLEKITEQVAQELLEDWAINDRFNENEKEIAIQNAVNDTALVINSFMELFNSAMLEEAQTSQNKLITD